MDQKQIVLSFISALDRRDYARAKSMVGGNFSFTSPVASIAEPAEYFRQMEGLGIRYDVKKAFADGDDVCVLYDYTIKGATRFGCGWYKLDGGKIVSLRIVSDAPAARP